MKQFAMCFASVVAGAYLSSQIGFWPVVGLAFLLKFILSDRGDLFE